MDKIIALTRQQREDILQQLRPDQVQALSEFTRYAMLSRFVRNACMLLEVRDAQK